nr:hypothetical protein [Tanacetum cinerariifolium]
NDLIVLAKYIRGFLHYDENSRMPKRRDNFKPIVPRTMENYVRKKREEERL